MKYIVAILGVLLSSCSKNDNKVDYNITGVSTFYLTTGIDSIKVTGGSALLGIYKDQTGNNAGGTFTKYLVSDAAASKSVHFSLYHIADTSDLHTGARFNGSLDFISYQVYDILFYVKDKHGDTINLSISGKYNGRDITSGILSNVQIYKQK